MQQVFDVSAWQNKTEIYAERTVANIAHSRSHSRFTRWHALTGAVSLRRRACVPRHPCRRCLSSPLCPLVKKGFYFSFLKNQKEQLIQRDIFFSLWPAPFFILLQINNNSAANKQTIDSSYPCSSSVYAELVRRGALSKTNQTVTSKSIPNTNPCNTDLRVKPPEPDHPDCDPVSLSSKLWSRTQNVEFTCDYD